jgi:hypothetical protein
LASCCRDLRVVLSPIVFRHLRINVRGKRWQRPDRWRGYKFLPNSSKELSQRLAHYTSRVVAPFVRSIEIKIHDFDERVAGTWAIDRIFSILPRFTHLTSLIVGQLPLHTVVVTGVPRLTPFRVKALQALTSLTSLEISGSCLPRHISKDLPQLRLTDLKITNYSLDIRPLSLRLDPDPLETLAITGPIPFDLPKTLPRLRLLHIRGGEVILHCLRFLIHHHCPNLDALVISSGGDDGQLSRAYTTEFKQTKQTQLALKTYTGPIEWVDLFTQNGTNLVAAELVGWDPSTESILGGLRSRAVNLRSLRLIVGVGTLSPSILGAACSFPQLEHLSVVSPQPQYGYVNVCSLRLIWFRFSYLALVYSASCRPFRSSPLRTL